VPDAVRIQFQLDPWYQKHIPAGPLPIVSSSNTSDPALRETAFIVHQMLGNRPDILEALANQAARVVVMAYNEYTTDIPEQREMTPKTYWDSRARGLGGRICSCAEENLLGFPGDPYSTENIFIHEFAHVIHGVALRQIDPSFSPRLEAAYASAIERGLWKGTYASTDAGEYWAEAVQSWFDNNRENDSLHNHVNTRAELEDYDPALAALCAEIFGANPWRYTKPMERDPGERAHLTGFSPDSTPRFQWRNVPIPDRPRVRLETALGEIELELDARAAPVTTHNFLHYAHERLYNDGHFFRAVTLANQPTNAIKIQVVQARASSARKAEFLSPIPLERTRDTGLRHLDGTVSMARTTPDSAQHHFFICIGDQPELDFGGQRNPDRHGFAAFGRVVKGMDLVRRIHTAPVDGQRLSPPIDIQRAIRLN
jgi:cyclophilin family peptidyl-prolyl cis-trans isomerase